MSEKHLNERQAAEYVNLSVFTLRHYRNSRRRGIIKGPDYVKGEGRMGRVQYPKAELDKWLRDGLLRSRSAG